MLQVLCRAKSQQNRAVTQILKQQLGIRSIGNAARDNESWVEQLRLLCAPKGFGKYSRKGGSKEGSTGAGVENGAAGKSAKSGPKAGETSKPGSKNDKSGGSGGSNNNKSGGGGGSKNNQNGMPNFGEGGSMERFALASLVAFSAIALMSDEIKSGREINWQEFQTQLLEGGHVDRIIVTNKNIARVVLRSSSPIAAQHGGGGGQASDAFADRPPSSSGASDGMNGGLPNSPLDAMRRSMGLGAGAGAGGAAASRSQDDGRSPFEQGYDAGAAGGAPGAGTDAYTRYPSLGSPSPKQANSAYYFNIGTVETFERKLEDAQRSLGIAPRDFIPVIYVSETSWSHELLRFMPTLLLIGAMVYMMRGAAGGMGGGSGGPGGIFRIGKSNAKRVNKESVTTTFNDVAGCDEAKREILEFVQFLQNPKKFTDLGAKIPKGALLCGPPGTGKTLLAKATAGEANVPFFSISGSDFVEMFVGVGPSRVRDLFKEARENSPCILFIDEIDAVGRKRGGGQFSGGNDERENTLNQLLVEMDGFDSSTNIVILAGTNRVDVLDQALTRPGRFDRQIQVDKPDIAGRKAIFEVYLKGITLDGPADDYSGRLAALTPGFVGADIANICNEAAIIAARRNKTKVDLLDFESATDRVIGGLESNKIMSEEERRVVAYHEAGHAVAGWNLEFADPLLKVTIVPRGSGALGFAQYLPKELFLRTREQILDIVCMALAGRAAEQITFGRVTTGAADDLRRVTQIVYQMVQVYGMNERVGQVAFPREDSQYPNDRMYSNATAEVMDEEVRSIVEEAYARTLKLMEERREQVKLVAEMLLEKETITNLDVTNLIGARPYSAGKEYDEYVTGGWGVKMNKDGDGDAADTDTAAAVESAEEQKQQKDGEDGDAPLTGGPTLSPS
mmetsp:Transcript_6710/g.11214  ORF Transcript_6710/g.11214 Transcript_6710/m.11214 type:complete len:903 (+) Transcript_6710:84-2792(+)